MNAHKMPYVCVYLALILVPLVCSQYHTVHASSAHVTSTSSTSTSHEGTSTSTGTGTADGPDSWYGPRSGEAADASGTGPAWCTAPGCRGRGEADSTILSHATEYAVTCAQAEERSSADLGEDTTRLSRPLPVSPHPLM